MDNKCFAFSFPDICYFPYTYQFPHVVGNQQVKYECRVFFELFIDLYFKVNIIINILNVGGNSSIKSGSYSIGHGCNRYSILCHFIVIKIQYYFVFTWFLIVFDIFYSFYAAEKFFNLPCHCLCMCLFCTDNFYIYRTAGWRTQLVFFNSNKIKFRDICGIDILPQIFNDLCGSPLSLCNWYKLQLNRGPVFLIAFKVHFFGGVSANCTCYRHNLVVRYFFKRHFLSFHSKLFCIFKGSSGRRRVINNYFLAGIVPEKHESLQRFIRKYDDTC